MSIVHSLLFVGKRLIIRFKTTNILVICQRIIRDAQCSFLIYHLNLTKFVRVMYAMFGSSVVQFSISVNSEIFIAISKFDKIEQR